MRSSLAFPVTWIGLATVAIALTSAPPRAAAQSKPADKPKPNVLLILTDDQGYGDLGLHGNEKIDTPTLDRLAAESTRFERFMVCPLCSMTRASLLTGRYNLRTGCGSVTRGMETVRPEEVLIPELLKTAGYATGCFGKWHIGEYYPSHPRGQGFDEFFGMPQGHWDNYFDPTLEHDGEMVPAKGYISDVLTDAAMEFIRRKRDGPFFCYLPYNAPHTPMQIADSYYDKYKARGLDNKPAAIYGMVENIDENVARLLGLLDELKIADDTIVIFLSDNGAEGAEGSRFNAGMRGMKSSVHEGGMRVPMFVRWPGKIEAGRVLPQLAAHLDLLPTLAELCGASTEDCKPLDGRSLAGLLLKGSDPDWPKDRTIFSRSIRWWSLKDVAEPVVASVKIPYPGAVRTERWRAVNEGEDKGGWQLFDMRADPGQSKNVASDHPGEISRLARAYDDWFAEVSRVPLTRPVIDVGHRDWPRVKLTVPEAHFTGTIDWYNGYGFAHDWLAGWSDPADKIWWECNVVTAGRYRVRLKYACGEDAVGTKLRIRAGESSLDGGIEKAHPPNPVQRPTRIIKKRFVQTFVEQDLGEIGLQKGRSRITIEAIDKPGKEVCDVHSLILVAVNAETETAARGGGGGGGGGAGGSANDDLPSRYDRSLDPAFPPVLTQTGPTCAGWASSYYSASFVLAGHHPKENFIGSPRWTYNFVNGGLGSGSWADDHFLIQVKHGLPTRGRFDPPGLKSWCADPRVWREAIRHRMKQRGIIGQTHTEASWAAIKKLLVDGRNGVAIRTPSPGYGPWQWTTIKSGPAKGEIACHYVTKDTRLHHMAVVGYDDEIWIDVNENGAKDDGELGAFKLVDSYGTERHNRGFCWLAYDATRRESVVADGPSENRAPAFWTNRACWVTARDSPYDPALLAEFTLRSAARGDIRMKFFRTDAGGELPKDGDGKLNGKSEEEQAATWTPGIFSKQFQRSEERIGFDGKTYPSSADAPEMTFVFDLSDIARLDGKHRYFMELSDIAAGKPVTLSAFKLTDADGRVFAGAGDEVLPVTVDDRSIRVGIDWFGGEIEEQ